MIAVSVACRGVSRGFAVGEFGGKVGQAVEDTKSFPQTEYSADSR
jgi:hypothetical protein